MKNRFILNPTEQGTPTPKGARIWRSLERSILLHLAIDLFCLNVCLIISPSVVLSSYITMHRKLSTTSLCTGTESQIQKGRHIMHACQLPSRWFLCSLLLSPSVSLSLSCLSLLSGILCSSCLSFFDALSRLLLALGRNNGVAEGKLWKVENQSKLERTNENQREPERTKARHRLGLDLFIRVVKDLFFCQTEECQDERV